MDEQPPKANAAEILQLLITEHTNLQAVRSATVFEANGRTNLYLGAVSSSIVALAFIGQISEMSQPFFIFAFILLPSLIFLGVVTFVRVYQTGIEDMIASRGINRIRHYYTEIAPQVKDYFILSTHDDMQGVLQNMGAGEPGWWQLFVSTHGLIGVINSVLAAVFVGLITTILFKGSLALTVIIGVAIFTGSIMLHFNYQSRTYNSVEKSLHIYFPSKPKN